MRCWRVEFPHTAWPALELPDLTALSEALSVDNSPLLFGCRSGLCGTCLIEVEQSGEGQLMPPSADEVETLSIYAPDNPRARLACQIHLSADLRICKL